MKNFENPKVVVFLSFSSSFFLPSVHVRSFSLPFLICSLFSLSCLPCLVFLELITHPSICSSKFSMFLFFVFPRLLFLLPLLSLLYLAKMTQKSVTGVRLVQTDRYFPPIARATFPFPASSSSLSPSSSLCLFLPLRLSAFASPSGMTSVSPTRPQSDRHLLLVVSSPTEPAKLNQTTRRHGPGEHHERGDPG